jgi:NADH-quinone oxidoreductase subunit A
VKCRTSGWALLGEIPDTRTAKGVVVTLYTNVLIMFLAAGLIGALALAVGGLLGPKRAGETKLAAYESGIPSQGSARERFPVHFYLVAMLFIIFDIETAFLFPLAVNFNIVPQFLFVQAIIFIGVLAVGYVYILKKGVLNWK